MITAVTRSARIEAARLASSGWQADFFDQIGAQAVPAIQMIGDCAADHSQVMHTLSAASASLRRFAVQYAPALTSLATRLDGMVPRIEECRQSSVATTSRAAAQSRKVADALGEAVVAIQGGDSTRQRLEHAVTGLRLVSDVASGALSVPAGLSAAGRASLDSVTRRVVCAQLRATAASMAKDVQTADRVLATLTAEFDATIRLSSSLSDHEASGAPTFLTRFEDELRQASELIGACNTARGDLDAMTVQLMAAVGQFRDAAATLSDTVSTIVLIGMNASLNASRLGIQGRVLAVIAQEIKALADSIAAGTGQLVPIFTEMQAGASAIDQRGAGRIERLQALEGVFRGLLATMRESRDGIGSILGSLAQDSAACAASVREALAALAEVAHAAGAMTEVAGTLDPGPTEPAGQDGKAIADLLHERLFRIYTMEEERRIHRDALAACGIKTAATPVPATDATNAVFDDFLL